jgi:YegS/Rv2252/BmrU family lipid kinase
MSRPVRLIVNPSAGGGRAARALPAYEAALRAAGIEFRTALTTGLLNATELAREAAAAGETAAAMGGDGLVGCVAGALRGTGGVLAVLPGGRGNDFARVLGIPRDPEGAVAVLAAGEERDLDLGEVDGRPFVGIASYGYDSECNELANETRWIRGNLVYLYSALRTLATWKPAHFTIELDGERHEFSGYSVVAANSKAYGGGMYVAPAAELDDGLLDVVVTTDVSKWRFLSQLPKVFKGTHVDNPEVQVFRAREVRMSADRPFTIFADGDPIGEVPATARAVAGAVRVIVPPTAP